MATTSESQAVAKAIERAFTGHQWLEGSNMLDAVMVVPERKHRSAAEEYLFQKDVEEGIRRYRELMKQMEEAESESFDSSNLG